MFVSPSHPGGVVPGARPLVAQAAVGAIAGVRAVEGGLRGQEEERGSADAGVVFEHGAVLPPLESYGPDGRRVGEAEAEAAEAGEDHPILETKASEEGEGAEESAKGDPSREPSREEQAQLRELQARDLEVRAHEAAHVAAGGSFVRGGASFSYETGPDGRQYAVEGEVGIDTAKVSGDNEATLAKARTIRAAALAPANPSGADRAIAARAAQMEAQAMAELVEEQREQRAEASGEVGRTPWDRVAGDHAAEASPGQRLSIVA